MSPHMFTESVNYWMPLVAVSFAFVVCFGMITIFILKQKQEERKVTETK